MSTRAKEYKLKHKIVLIKIKKNGTHIKPLFEMLIKRKVNISHKSPPSYSHHKNFVLNHPYRAWYLVKQNNEFVGNAYILKNNFIGININKNSRIITPALIKILLRKHKPLKSIKSVRVDKFSFNVAHNDKEYISILEKMGAKLAQVTYIFEK